MSLWRSDPRFALYCAEALTSVRASGAAVSRPYAHDQWRVVGTAMRMRPVLLDFLGSTSSVEDGPVPHIATDANTENCALLQTVAVSSAARNMCNEVNSNVLPLLGRLPDRQNSPRGSTFGRPRAPQFVRFDELARSISFPAQSTGVRI